MNGRSKQSVMACFASLFVFQASNADVIVSDDFESGMRNWRPSESASAAIVEEPGKSNQVLELTPSGIFPLQGKRGLSYVLLQQAESLENVRMEGRFYFPTDGDGYLGFIYNHRTSLDRSDFGSIYVKSNGSYVRVSPHYDGNPSWRLYEDLRVDLDGQRRIRPETWYPFRLDVRGRCALLYIQDFVSPVASFDQFPHGQGTLGLEARPGRGDPVWVDDVRVSELPESGASCVESESKESRLYGWQTLGPLEPENGATLQFPDLDDRQWSDLPLDSRGAVITALQTQTASGNKSTTYVRVRFDATESPENSWLAISSANRLDVWLNGFFRGTVAADRYAWETDRKSTETQSARLPIAPRPGINEVLIRVHGDRFAGGGFYADIISPE